jgi:hypothetical protein
MLETTNEFSGNPAGFDTGRKEKVSPGFSPIRMPQVKSPTEEAMQTANCAGVDAADLRELAAPKAEDSELEEKYSAGDRYFKGEMPRLTKIQQ